MTSELKNEDIIMLQEKVKKKFMREWSTKHDDKGYYNWTIDDDRIIEMVCEEINRVKQ